ncbi:MAG: hypothetical protein ACR2P0_06735 [Acidimicrobiales bacterium]
MVSLTLGVLAPTEVWDLGLYGRTVSGVKLRGFLDEIGMTNPDRHMSGKANTVVDMVVIKKASWLMVGIIAVLVVPTVLNAVTNPTPLAFVWVAIGVAIVWRVSRLKVGVDHDGVTVLNFFRTTKIPIWEAEPEIDDPEAGVLLSDAGGKYDQGGRTIYIRRPWHNDRIHVGVAPRYGTEVERIHHDLLFEIKRQRAA